MLTAQQTLKITKTMRLARVGDVFATAEQSLLSRIIRLVQSIKRRRRVYTSHNAAVCRGLNGGLCVLNCDIPRCKRVALLDFLTDMEERGVPWSLLRLSWRLGEEGENQEWEDAFSAKLLGYDGVDYPERDLWEQLIIGIFPFMRFLYKNSDRPYCTDSVVKAMYAAAGFHGVDPIFSVKYTSPALVERALREAIMQEVIYSVPGGSDLSPFGWMYKSQTTPAEAGT